MDVIIIGCGPAGLAVAARLYKRGIPFTVLESSEKIANAWHNHYDRLHLHTVKQFSHLPYEPFPENYPTYVSRLQLVNYLEEYANKYNIHPRFNTTVEQVSKESGRWSLRSSQGVMTSSHVIVAAGVNRIPTSPEWKGKSSFKGTIMHSRYYKNPSPFIGKKVLVVGMGNTGAEVALDLSEADIETHIAVRSPISVVPRDLNGRPVQITSKQLAKLPFGIGDWLGNQIRKIYFGNLEKYGLRASPMPPAVQLRETGKTPVIDIGTIDAIKRGKITVRPDVQMLSENTVRFSDGTEDDFDMILLATGYDAGLSALIPGIKDFLDDNGLPRAPIATNPWKGLYFIGYDNYKLGGILGTILTDSEIIANAINKNYQSNE